MSTFVDGAPSSMSPGPDDGDPKDPHRDPERDEDGLESGSVWLQEEIQRRIAAGRRASKGRHARHEVASSTSSISYVPRHSTATPGPGALPPASLGTPARGIPRMPAAWSSPEAGAGPDGPAAGSRPSTGAVADPDRDADQPTGGHRRAMLSGGIAVVAVGDAPPPWRSGDPLPAASVRSVHAQAPEAEGVAATESAPGKRVRVVLSERRGGARSVRTVVDIQENTDVGALLRANLIKNQLSVALRFAALAGGVLALLPLLFWLFPDIGRTEVLGLRVPWLLLGILVYPFLLVIAWWHTCIAERVEQGFADHVQE